MRRVYGRGRHKAGFARSGLSVADKAGPAEAGRVGGVVGWVISILI